MRNKKATFITIATVVIASTALLLQSKRGQDITVSESHTVKNANEHRPALLSTQENASINAKETTPETVVSSASNDNAGKNAFSTSELQADSSTGSKGSGIEEETPSKDSRPVKGFEMLSDAKVLMQRDSAPNQSGVFIREKIVAGTDDLPFIRVISHLRETADSQELHVVSTEAMAADQVLVKPQPGLSTNEFENTLSIIGAQIQEKIFGTDVYIINLANNDLDAVPDALAYLATDKSRIEIVEANGIGTGSLTPNDTHFGIQWGLHNTGQSGGTVDADIDMPETWDITTGSNNVVVAVLDSGLDQNHPDLTGILWINPNEIAGNGTDDDGNGLVDDVNGWDFTNGDNNPYDDHSHGTHVTGTIAANGNNATGVAGVAWQVKIVPIKILNSSNLGTTSNLISAINYAANLNIDMMNLSLQNYPYSSSVRVAIDTAESNGILMVIAAGNNGTNNDSSPNYPSSYLQDNIIAVANTTRYDALYSGSSFGQTSVDLAAPGTTIRSTVPTNKGSYAYFTGTSMAAPHVTGTAVLLKAVKPSLTYQEIKAAILDNVDTIPSLSGKVATGGRLNAYNAVNATFEGNNLMEVDSVTVNQSNDPNQWHSVTFQNSFQVSPVVVMGPPSFNGGDPCTMRVRNVTNSGFEFRIDEWNYLDPGGHAAETISYIAMEPGVHILGGRKWEANIVTNVNHNWKTHNSETTFGGSQTLLTQCMTANGGAAVTVRAKDMTASSFTVRVQEEENEDDKHAQETVGYIFIAGGTGNINGIDFRASKTTDVTHNWETINFGFGGFANPLFFASNRTANGDDPVAIRYRNLTANNVEIFNEEEKSADSEINHIAETVSWLVIGN